MDVARRQVEHLSRAQHGRVHQQRDRDTRVARVGIGEAPHRVPGDIVGTGRSLDNGRDQLVHAIAAGDEPFESGAQRGVVDQPIEQRRDPLVTRDRQQQSAGLLHRAEAAQRTEPVTEGVDDLGLGRCVFVVALGGIQRHPGRVLGGETRGGLLRRRVRLQRQGGCRGQHLEQERQPRRDVGQSAAAEKPGRGPGVRSEPQL